MYSFAAEKCRRHCAAAWHARDLQQGTGFEVVTVVRAAAGGERPVPWLARLEVHFVSFVGTAVDSRSAEL